MPPPLRYPSDLSNEQWALLEPLLASPEKRGRPSKWPQRRMADAVFYLLRSGAEERMCLADAPARVPAVADTLLPLAPQVAA